MNIAARYWMAFIAGAGMGAATSQADVRYYVHPITGNDANAGTDPKSPLKTLQRAGSLRLQAGDHLYLAAGQKFTGQLSFAGLAGTDSNPIVISSYPTSAAAGDVRASIDARGWSAAVRLQNCAQVTVANLMFTANGGGMKEPRDKNAAMRCGVLILADKVGNYHGLSLSNILVRDVCFKDPGFVRSAKEARTANGTQAYGWGIRFISTRTNATLKDITIRDCEIERVSHTGLKFTGTGRSIQNISVRNVRVTDTGGPGVQMSGVQQGRFSGLDVNRSGSTNDTRNWGRGSGLWTWGSSDVVIEKSRFQNANGPGDSAGVHIDFNCRDIIVQHNLSANNAGGFCEILGNNYNCAYRYNVSVNDGFRVKGKNGAFQEGKIFWLSGYTGNKSPPQGPFNTYFYNNTIYVSEKIVAKIAMAPTAEGVLIANNVFCLEGRSQLVSGDQFQPDSDHVTGLKNLVFENNLFLRADNWPAGLVIRDRSPILGDPGFCKAGGLTLEDYMPRNAQLIKNRGIRISRIPQDDTGLMVGLDVERDILGNKISGNPDLGAIEMP